MKALEEGDIDSETGKIMQRTWAYRHKDGEVEARIFLTPGAETPEGWEDTPAKCQDPPKKRRGRPPGSRNAKPPATEPPVLGETGPLEPPPGVVNPLVRVSTAAQPDQPEGEGNDHDADDS